MSQQEEMEKVLEYIEANLKESLTAADLAARAGYSVFYFSSQFAKTVGMPVKAYVLWRKLLHATYDLSRGAKVTDAAMDYGFETHAGFTKAFKRIFGFPPSLCYTRIQPKIPEKPTVFAMKHYHSGGAHMQPHIFELSPFSVIGYPQHQHMPNVTHTGDIPNYWDTIQMDYGPLLTRLHETFPYSKHMEISICYDTDEKSGAFTYLLGRGVDDPRDLERIEPDMTRVDIPGGLYAIFSTPLSEEAAHSQAVRDTWNQIFTQWLPSSEFEYDDNRCDFEYYDYRDHGWYFGGKIQIDIMIPIRQKEEESVKSKLRTGCDTP